MRYWAQRLRLRAAILWWKLRAEICLQEKRALEWLLKMMDPGEVKT